MENKPVKSFGNGLIKVAVWENTIKINGKDIKKLSVTLTKSYKDAQGNWKQTGSLDTNELSRAICFMNEAYKFMISGDKEE